MSNSVFDNLSDDNEVQDTPTTPIVTTSKEKNLTTSENGKIVTTLKGGPGFDAPWIVVHTDTVDEAIAILKEGSFDDLVKATSEASDKFNGGQKPPAQRQGGAPRTQGRPAGADQPRPNDPPMPDGYEYRTGVNKNGKAYRAYFPPKGSNESPVWLPN